MIYLTGDIHGGIDIDKLLNDDFRDKVKKGDYLIICGDFGLIWDYRGESEQERNWLDFLNNEPYTVLFVDGNHENFTRLNNDYESKSWHGGMVHVIRDSIFHLQRGQMFKIENKIFFTMGGATSIDKFIRIEGKSWWKEELPNGKEYREALVNLILYKNKVDYVITHCLPTHIQKEVSDYKYEDDLTDFLERLSEVLKFKEWFCGHYHVDTKIGKYRVLYQDIITLGEEIIVEDIE